MKKIWFVSIGLLLSMYLIWSGCAGKVAEKDPALVKRPALSKKPEKPPWKPMYLGQCYINSFDDNSYHLMDEFSFIYNKYQQFFFGKSINLIDTCVLKSDEILPAIKRVSTYKLTIRMCREADWISSPEFLKILPKLNHLAFTNVKMTDQFINKILDFFKNADLSLHFDFIDDGSPDFYKNLNKLKNLRNIYGIRFETSTTNLEKLHTWVLPENIKYFILSFGERINLRTTSQWLSKFKSLELIDINFSFGYSDDPDISEFFPLRHLKNLKFLELPFLYDNVKTDMYNEISKIIFLKSVNLNNFLNAEKSDLEALTLKNCDCKQIANTLRKFPKLKIIELEEAISSSECFKVIAELKNLKTLAISSTFKIDDIKTILKSQTIENLYITHFSKLISTSVKPILKIKSDSLKTLEYSVWNEIVLELDTKNLKSLKLGSDLTLKIIGDNQIKNLHITSIDPDTLKSFFKLDKLEYLQWNLSESVPDSLLSQIFSKKGLISLHISNKILDLSFKCSKLKYLLIRGSKVGKKFLTSLAKCSEFQKLDLEDVYFLNKSQFILNEIPKLSSLSVSRSILNSGPEYDIDLKSGSGFENLKILELQTYFLKTIDGILRMKNLKHLTISRSELNQSEIEKLHTLKSLNYLKLTRFSDLSDNRALLEKLFKKITFIWQEVSRVQM